MTFARMLCAKRIYLLATNVERRFTYYPNMSLLIGFRKAEQNQPHDQQHVAGMWTARPFHRTATRTYPCRQFDDDVDDNDGVDDIDGVGVGSPGAINI